MRYSTHIVVTQECDQVVGVPSCGCVLVVLFQYVEQVSGIAVTTGIEHGIGLKAKVDNRRQTALAHKCRENILTTVKDLAESEDIWILGLGSGDNLWPPLAEECIVNVLCGVNSETVDPVVVYPL